MNAQIIYETWSGAFRNAKCKTRFYLAKTSDPLDRAPWN